MLNMVPINSGNPLILQIKAKKTWGIFKMFFYFLDEIHLINKNILRLFVFTV